jgi:hypothetical protein
LKLQTGDEIRIDVAQFASGSRPSSTVELERKFRSRLLTFVRPLSM